MEQLDLTFVDQIVAKVGTGQEKVLEILQAIQGHYGYLPNRGIAACVRVDGDHAGLDRRSFHVLRPVPASARRPAHHPRLRGDRLPRQRVRPGLWRSSAGTCEIPEGEDTDAQKLFTVEKIACLGCCTLAPAVQIDEITYGHLTRESVPKVLKDFLRHEQARAAAPGKPRRLRPGSAGFRGEVRIGLGSCCQARGSGRLHVALQDALAQIGARCRSSGSDAWACATRRLCWRWCCRISRRSSMPGCSRRMRRPLSCGISASSGRTRSSPTPSPGRWIGC